MSFGKHPDHPPTDQNHITSLSMASTIPEQPAVTMNVFDNDPRGFCPSAKFHQPPPNHPSFAPKTHQAFLTVAPTMKPLGAQFPQDQQFHAVMHNTNPAQQQQQFQVIHMPSSQNSARLAFQPMPQFKTPPQHSASTLSSQTNELQQPPSVNRFTKPQVGGYSMSLLVNQQQHQQHSASLLTATTQFPQTTSLLQKATIQFPQTTPQLSSTTNPQLSSTTNPQLSSTTNPQLSSATNPQQPSPTAESQHRTIQSPKTGKRHNSQKNSWTLREDELLKDAVASFGDKSWSLVAAQLGTRDGKQCRDRWCNHLVEGVVKGDWTEEEDKILFEAQRELGNQWAEISRRYLPGRTDLSVKNRFYSAQRKRSRQATLQRSQQQQLGNNEAHAHEQRVHSNPVSASAAPRYIQGSLLDVSVDMYHRVPIQVLQVAPNQSYGQTWVCPPNTINVAFPIANTHTSAPAFPYPVYHNQPCELAAPSASKVPAQQIKRDPEVQRPKRRKVIPEIVGRWTDDEHQRFLDAIKEFGTRSWPTIAQAVKTRTVIQVRTHAQKYFKKQERIRARKAKQELVAKEIAARKNAKQEVKNEDDEKERTPTNESDV